MRGKATGHRSQNTSLEPKEYLKMCIKPGLGSRGVVVGAGGDIVVGDGVVGGVVVFVFFAVTEMRTHIIIHTQYIRM